MPSLQRDILHGRFLRRDLRRLHTLHAAQPDRHGEGRAEPLFALDADLAVHHLHDASGDRHAEAAAAGAVRAEQRRKLQHEGEGEDELEDAAQNAQNAQQARGRAEAQPQSPRGGGGGGDHERAERRNIDRACL